MSTAAVSKLPEHVQCGSYASDPWYLIRSKPCQEDRACHFLSLLGVEVLLPLYTPHKSSQRKPFFPGYLFGAFPLELFNKVNNAFGVRKIVCFGGIPAIVHNDVIAEIRGHMDRHGLLGMPEELTAARFKQGDSVRVVSGPLKGFHGVFDCELTAKDRVRILLNTVGCSFSGWHSATHGAAMNIEVSKRDLMLV